ncbi:(3S,6E)-nerolidol synthase 1-like [Dioscorea cayenensis subsp. rotundata]|uniref:(3S,6E)-nerolidol synthase 1-like n=1 Tax=Dioscorea cayennensis subsp. rotundata TaxID=55577 RepID=A0AB40C7V4_DIOCR|nr:(3S,6E)-nerolidol synthase 1-like [Dioscorea cayenensis subsp. rotundata]
MRARKRGGSVRSRYRDEVVMTAVVVAVEASNIDSSCDCDACNNACIIKTEMSSMKREPLVEEDRVGSRVELCEGPTIEMVYGALTMVPQPHHSKCRIELTKAIAFIYIIDDIFDVYGTLDELSVFTQAINKWDISAIDNLPNYMKWGKLCNAFLQEAKWFASKQVPNKDEYLRNAATSSGVFIVIVHLFFLMGQGLTLENIQHIENDPSFVSKSGTILRLWDDLGSAKDENQKGFDGSYLELHMKEHQDCTAKEAREHVMLMISRTWDALNKESFTQSSFPKPLINATLNLARMVRVMYSYDDNHHLPMLDDFVFSLLHHPL